MSSNLQIGETVLDNRGKAVIERAGPSSYIYHKSDTYIRMVQGEMSVEEYAENSLHRIAIRQAHDEAVRFPKGATIIGQAVEFDSL